MFRSVAIIFIASMFGCSPPDDSMRPVMYDPVGSGPDDPVAAVVGGEPIHLSRVLWISSETGRPPREVLDGMVEMTLLAQEAQRRGLMDEPAVKRTYKKALVQALLAEQVESKVDPDSVSMQEVRDYYIANYENKGVLLEDAWREIWNHLVARKRRALYDELIQRLREKFSVDVDEHNVELHLGGPDG